MPSPSPRDQRPERTIMKFGDSRGRLTILGDEFACGTYVLGITVHDDIEVTFGRFQQGRAIAVPRGEYSYVGSALGDSGSSCLARRMLRHASRSHGRQPHSIRSLMVEQFPLAGMQPKPAEPPADKRPRWHIDYLLDADGVELRRAILIRSPERLEGATAALVASLPETRPLAPGLGATDSPGRTHIFQVAAWAKWWDTLPEQLAARILCQNTPAQHS